MEQQDKNKWIEKAIRSFEGAKRAEPSDFLFGKIEKRVLASRPKATIIPLTMVTAAAACILLLVVLNIMLLNRQSKTASDPMREVANYYQLTNNSPLYSL